MLIACYLLTLGENLVASVKTLAICLRFVQQRSNHREIGHLLAIQKGNTASCVIFSEAEAGRITYVQHQINRSGLIFST